MNDGPLGEEESGTGIKGAGSSKVTNPNGEWSIALGLNQDRLVFDEKLLKNFSIDKRNGNSYSARFDTLVMHQSLANQGDQNR